MEIVHAKGFSNTFKETLNYTAKDSKNNAHKIKVELKLEIANIPDFPYKYRESNLL